jgi:hypothetical protein
MPVASVDEVLRYAQDDREDAPLKWRAPSNDAYRFPPAFFQAS